MPQSTPIKIVVLGELGVGKSALTLQFTQNQYVPDFDPTVEDVYTRNITIDDANYTLQVLDTAIQDEYSSLKDLQVKEADGVMIVYSVAHIETLRNMGDAYTQVMRVMGELPPTVLVGNQIDLVDRRQVSTSEGEQYAKEFGIIKFFETSARANINVTEAFTCLAQFIVERRKEKKRQLQQEKEKKKQQEKQSQKQDRIIRLEVSSSNDEDIQNASSLRAGSPSQESNTRSRTFTTTTGPSLERESTLSTQSQISAYSTDNAVSEVISTAKTDKITIVHTGRRNNRKALHVESKGHGNCVTM